MTRSPLLESDQALRQIVDRLIPVFQPVKIYLFGSRARGDSGPDSDYDIMMLINKADLPKYKLAQQAQRALWGLVVGADVLVLTLGEFEEASTVVCSLSSTVLREGKELYAA